MFFFRKANRPVISDREIARQYFGPDTVLRDYPRQPVLPDYPRVAPYGGVTEGECVVEGCYKGVRFRYSIGMMVYPGEDTGWHKCTFHGKYLSLPELCLGPAQTYFFTGPPFRSPDDPQWERIRLSRKMELWARHPMDAAQQEKTHQLLNWLDRYLSPFTSSRYAVYADSRGVDVVFWHVEENVFAVDAEMLRDALDKFPL